MDLKSLLNKAVVSKRLDGEKKGDKAMPANGGKTGRRAMDAETARRYQREIATRHGLPLESANAIGMRLALIPPGTFNTGDGSNDREVTFPRPFYLGILEVTQTQFQAVMDRNPSKFSGEPNLPTEMVTQAEAIEFCNQLSRREGLPACYHLSGRTRMVGDVKRNVWEMDLRAIGYRLPTDAEWEYACRAGSTAGYHFGNDSSHAERHGWFRVNSNQKTHPVGQKLPTPWGLFDMHGNVWEYCHPGEFDRKAKARYSIDEWIVRGASWLDDHEKWGGRLRDRFRIQNPSHRGHNVGFRVLRAAR